MVATFSDVTPSSSALIIAKIVQRSTLNKSTSVPRTSCASGSFEICSGRIRKSPGFRISLRSDPSSETSALNAPQRPAESSASACAG